MSETISNPMTDKPGWPQTGSLRPDEVVPLAAEHAREGDRDRQLHPKVHEALRGAGFARHFVAARWGGAEGGFLPCLEAEARIAREDPSAGWCASVTATLSRMAGFLPEEGQRTVWADGPVALVVGALVPGGSAVAAPGGWLLRAHTVAAQQRPGPLPDRGRGGTGRPARQPPDPPDGPRDRGAGPAHRPSGPATARAAR